MPNWCTGNLRIRGTKENLLRFISERIMYCIYDKDLNSIVKPCNVSWDDDTIYISSPYNDEQTKRSWIYIQGTHRNFFNYSITDDYNIELYPYKCEDDEYILFFSSFSAAWNIEPEPYVSMSKEYNIDIRIVGFECGWGFDMDILIEKGTLIRNFVSNYSSYSDFMWKSVMPDLGG